MVDNCRVHHSKKVKKFVVENQISIIYLVAYGPEFNPIERVWSKIKLQFKKERMGLVLQGQAPNFNKLLRGVLMKFPAEKICRVCDRTYQSMLAQ